MKPRMFIGSSTENLDLAYAVQEGLEHDVEVTVWTQGVFTLSRFTMASLVDQLDQSDFGLFVFAPNDLTTIRDESKRTVRDNVIFELGLFIGRLGPERSFLIVPRGVEHLHLPTDLAGITTAPYEPDRQDGNLGAALGSACNRVRRAVQKLGPLRPPQIAADATPSSEPDGLTDDPTDCRILIQSWLGSRPASSNRQAIRFDDVDRELRLARGSSRLHLEAAARHWGYLTAQKGADFILLIEDPQRWL